LLGVRVKRGIRRIGRNGRKGLEIYDVLFTGIYCVNVGAYAVELRGQLTDGESFARRFAIVVVLVIVRPVCA